ncbi:toxin [Streptomyces abyssalis]|uniref:Toxin n=1 Tax=Streptomyces abyssalis TaxID=933944 RepID=A0A1E7JHA4_9ACTN|nr:DUF397 domain-containing protein [Streptomyces abyssalis]OEU85841.1 toxin [Streptomyces abyssalis]OEU92695.1 toxin [Streptomyces abyssalis]
MTELAWCKSSYSDASGGDCVEVAVEWRKSSYSDSGGGDCVEVAATPAAVHVRDSKRADGPALCLPGRSWRAFLTAL